MNRTLTAAALVFAASLPTFASAQSAPGTAQLAANLGVNADRYSLNELVSLDKALRDDNRVGTNQILTRAGSDLTYDKLKAGIVTDPASVTAPRAAGNNAAAEATAKAQIAGAIGVNPENFTLNELVGLKAAVDEGDYSKVRAIFSRLGIDRSPLSVL
jgi:hypothetical protein